MEHGPDDLIPIESCCWGFWNGFPEDYVRLAQLIGLLALLTTLGFPQPTKAQEDTNYGVVCDTPNQVRRFVLASDAKAILARINAEKAQSCAVMNVMFYAGTTDGKIVTRDGVWIITHALVVGIIQHGGGIQPIEPKLVMTRRVISMVTSG